MGGRMFDEEQFRSFVDALAEAMLLKNVLVIGSWAEFLYQRCGVLSGYSAPMGTQDLDLLVRDIPAGDRPKTLAECAKTHGFRSRVDYATQVNMFSGRDGFEVEFLAQQNWGDRKKENGPRQPMTGIGLRATAMPDLWPMSEFYIQVRYEGYPILAPEPAAYVIHKMLINNTREGKAASDREKIAALMPYIEKTDIGMIYMACGGTERSRIDSYLRQHLSIPSMKYLLTDGKRELSMQELDTLGYSLREIAESTKEYRQVQKMERAGEASRDDLLRSRHRRADRMLLAAMQIKSLALSEDELWAEARRSGIPADDRALAISMLAQIDARIAQEKKRGEEKKKARNCGQKGTGKKRGNKAGPDAGRDDGAR